jgi:hypothetical protein
MMKLSKSIIAIVIVGLMSYACTAVSGSKSKPSANATKQDYEAALTAAKSAQKKAAAVGGEWRDIGKMLKEAEAASKSGDYVKAVTLANQAKLQGEAGYEQTESQKNAGPRF